MAILISPYFFAINSYAEGNSIASTSTVKKVNIASGSDVSFDVEEVDDEDEEEDNLTDYPDEPEDDIDEDLDNGEEGNLGSETGNLGSGDGNLGGDGGEPQNDSLAATSNSDNTSSSSDLGSNTQNELNNDLPNTSNQNYSGIATLSDASEVNNNDIEEVNNTSEPDTISSSSNIVPKLGLAPSTPFVPLGAAPSGYENTLCFTASTNATIGYTKNGSASPTLYYYKDGSGWLSAWDGTSVNLSTGESLYVRGDNSSGLSTSENDYINFVISGEVEASGNIMGLLDNGACTTDTIPCDYCFKGLFKGCGSLTSSPSLPAVTLTNACYYEMFYGCTSLEIPPNIPATTLADKCCGFMFYGCTSLILNINSLVPGREKLWKIPATSAGADWNRSMFYNCSNVDLDGHGGKTCNYNTDYYTKSPIPSGTWGTVPWEYDESSKTLTLTGETGKVTGIGADPSSIHCFDPGSLYMALTNETIFGSTGTGSLSKDQIREIKKVRFVEGTAKVIFGAGTSLENIFKDYRTTFDLDYPWRDLEEVDLSGADFSIITSLHSTFECVENLITITFPSSSFGSNITTTKRCFNRCGKLTTINKLDKLNTSSVTTMNGMFCACTSLKNIDLSKFNTSQVIDISEMFYLCKTVESLNLSSFDTGNVTNMEAMFRECIALSAINYGPNWNTSNVTTMKNMFRETLSMKKINVKKFNFASCITMEEMFCMAKGDFSVKNVSKLNEVMLPTSTSFATVTEMMGAFQGCTELVSINANVFNTTAATNYSKLFAGCEKLKELDLTNMSVSSTVSSYSEYMFGGSSVGSVSYSAPPINKITLGVSFVLPTGSDTGLVDKAWGGSDSTTYTNTASMLSDHGGKSLVVTYTAPSSPTPTPTPTPTPVPSSGGGGSGGGGGGGGSVDPAGKPLDPQIVAPGIVTNPDSLVNPNTNVIPGTPMPNTTKININYDNSTTKKVVVSKAPSVNYDESDNLRLYLTGEDGVTYMANYGFFDVEVKNINSDQIGTIDTYYVNEYSILVSGWIETANQNRYFMENAEINNSGKMCHGWKRIVNDWYYFDYDGKMMKNTKTYDGFTVDKDGKMTNPAYLDKALINGKQKRTVYTMEKSYKHD